MDLEQGDFTQEPRDVPTQLSAASRAASRTEAKHNQVALFAYRLSSGPIKP
jgi:hypothetical protein